MADIGAETAPVLGERTTLSISWSAVFGGAVCGAGLAFVLDAFGAAIGLAVSSAAPTWRDASFALAFLSGIYLILTAVVSFGAGAYIAARIADRFSGTAEEREIRDGAIGLVVWGVMTLATALILTIATSGLSRLSAPVSGATEMAESVAGENIIAFDLDKLFRSGPKSTATPTPYQRAEAARILLTTSSHHGLSVNDRNYLVALVERVTGLPPAEAQTRVNGIADSAKQTIDRGRNSGVILAFMVAAATLLGALAAWVAAAIGGRQREGMEGVWQGMDWRVTSIRF